MRIPGFVGPSNTQRSSNLDNEDTINFYLEKAAPGSGKAKDTFVGTPCLRPFTMLTGGVVRGLFAQDGLAFASDDGHAYELFSDGMTSTLGAIASDDFPVSYCSNGTAGQQVMLTSGGLGYVLNLTSGVFGLITDPQFPENVRMCAFMDGYGIVLVAESRQFNISALEDFTDWDALDVAQRSEASDDVNALLRTHREIWLLGTQTSEVWFDNGDALLPFAPIQGTFIEQGSVASFAAVRMDNTIIWLGRDEHGSGVVFRANGYTPERISTHAMELDLGTSTDLSAAIGWSYQDEGHLFYILYVPDLDWTWVYDVNAALWHKRARLIEFDADNNPTWEPDPGRCHCFAYGKHLVGDRASGMIYELSLEFLSDVLADAASTVTFPLFEVAGAS